MSKFVIDGVAITIKYAFSETGAITTRIYSRYEDKSHVPELADVPTTYTGERE